MAGSSYTQIWFGLRCMFPTWSDWDITYTSKGLAKKRTRTILRSLALVATIVGIIRMRNNGIGRDNIKALLQSYVRYALLGGASVLQAVSRKI